MSTLVELVGGYKTIISSTNQDGRAAFISRYYPYICAFHSILFCDFSCFWVCFHRLCQALELSRRNNGILVLQKHKCLNKCSCFCNAPLAPSIHERGGVKKMKRWIIPKHLDMVLGCIPSHMFAEAFAHSPPVPALFCEWAVSRKKNVLDTIHRAQTRVLALWKPLSCTCLSVSNSGYAVR